MKVFFTNLIAIILLTTQIVSGETAGFVNDPSKSPPQSGTITVSDGCVGSNATFTVNGSSATTGYTWNLPSGMTNITGNPTAKTITVSFSTAGLDRFISVSGNGLNAANTVDVYTTPSGTGVLSGQPNVCAGQTDVPTPFQDCQMSRIIHGLFHQGQRLPPEPVPVP